MLTHVNNNERQPVYTLLKHRKRLIKKSKGKN